MKMSVDFGAVFALLPVAETPSLANKSVAALRSL